MKSPKSVCELVRVVEEAFEEFSPMKSNQIFLSLQLCMIEIMKVKGSNHYKIPHLKKETLIREGHLPLSTKCDPILVDGIIKQIST